MKCCFYCKKNVSVYYKVANKCVCLECEKKPRYTWQVCQVRFEEINEDVKIVHVEKHEREDAIIAAKDFFRSISNGNWQTAYSFLSCEMKLKCNLRDFILLAGKMDLRNSVSSDWPIYRFFKVGKEQFIELKGHAKSNYNTCTPITVVLVNRESEWKINSMRNRTNA